MTNFNELKSFTVRLNCNIIYEPIQTNRKICAGKLFEIFGQKVKALAKDGFLDEKNLSQSRRSNAYLG